MVLNVNGQCFIFTFLLQVSTNIFQSKLFFHFLFLYNFKIEFNVLLLKQGSKYPVKNDLLQSLTNNHKLSFHLFLLDWRKWDVC